MTTSAKFKRKEIFKVKSPVLIQNQSRQMLYQVVVENGEMNLQLKLKCAQGHLRWGRLGY